MGGKSSKGAFNQPVDKGLEHQVSQISYSSRKRNSSLGSDSFSESHPEIKIASETNTHKSVVAPNKKQIKQADSSMVCLTTLESILALFVASERFNQLLEDDEAIKNRLDLPQNQERGVVLAAFRDFFEIMKSNQKSQNMNLHKLSKMAEFLNPYLNESGDKVASVFLSAFLQGFRTIWLEAEEPADFKEKNHLSGLVIALLEKAAQGDINQPGLVEILLRDLEIIADIEYPADLDKSDITARAAHVADKLKSNPSEDISHLLLSRMFTQAQNFLYDTNSGEIELTEEESRLVNSFKWFCLQEIKETGLNQQVSYPKKNPSKYFNWDYFHFTSFFNVGCLSFPRNLIKPITAQLQANLIVLGVPQGYMVLEFVKSLGMSPVLESPNLYPTVADLAEKVSHYTDNPFWWVDYECAVVYQNELKMHIEHSPKSRVFSSPPSFDHNVSIHFSKPGTYSNADLFKVLLVNTTKSESSNMPNILCTAHPDTTLGEFLEEFVKQTRPNSANMLQALVDAIFEKLLICDEVVSADKAAAESKSKVFEKFNSLRKSKALNLKTKFSNLQQLLGMKKLSKDSLEVPFLFHFPVSDSVSFEFLSKSTSHLNKPPLSLKPSLSSLLSTLITTQLCCQKPTTDNLRSLLPRYLYLQTDSISHAFSINQDLELHALNNVLSDVGLDAELLPRYRLSGLVAARPDGTRYPIYVEGNEVYCFSGEGKEVRGKRVMVRERAVVGGLWERREAETM